MALPQSLNSLRNLVRTARIQASAHSQPSKRYDASSPLFTGHSRSLSERASKSNNSTPFTAACAFAVPLKRLLVTAASEKLTPWKRALYPAPQDCAKGFKGIRVERAQVVRGNEIVPEGIAPIRSTEITEI